MVMQLHSQPVSRPVGFGLTKKQVSFFEHHRSLPVGHRLASGLLCAHGIILVIIAIMISTAV
jgi:hypothetical protein